VALPALTAPEPFALAAEPVPAPSKESSLTHRLQTPDSRSDGQVYGGYVRRENTANCRCWQPRRAQESRPYKADAAGGRVEGDGGVRILSILMAIACTGERSDRFFMLAGRNKF